MGGIWERNGVKFECGVFGFFCYLCERVAEGLSAE